MIEINENSDFSIYNIPFGIYSKNNQPKRVAVAVGEAIIDLFEFYKLGGFPGIIIEEEVLQNDFLNDFISLGKTWTNEIRKVIQDFLITENHPLWNLQSQFVYLQSAIKLHLPIKIGDYTDFYSSEQHAKNVGEMFRDPLNALLPNWKHLPVAYHGRASSIYVSGTDFHRPKGQIKQDNESQPIFSATQKLDFELEIAAVIGKNTSLGQSIDVNRASEYVFGFLLLNDWSARDIQHWEYMPLGPFLSKNFFSSVSPWVVTAEALEPFMVSAGEQSPVVLEYLNEKTRYNYDVDLEVIIKTKEGTEQIISKSNYKYLYWTVNQQIAHHTINGCAINVGDLMASGTISGTRFDSFGSMLELSWDGKNPRILQNKQSRSFIEDYDTIVFKGFAEKNGIRVGFGSLQNTVLPALYVQF